ncbi:MAG: sporulation protein [Betaproteobacteria bacterium HGW-Betaproteobacteria-21]|nr:MAG: sporulation protein [Betaproteobacteria bacterium HGW-Betaproteobacteria-21]
MSDAENLEIKKRARRRLVGAAALALLAAIVLPMAMDQEPQVSSQDIQISIPDRDATASEARPIAARERHLVEPDVAPAPLEQAPVAGSAPTPAPAPAPVPAPAAASRPPPAVSVDNAVAAVKPAPAAPRDEEAERVKALLGGVPPAQVQQAASAAESFVLQVGAFSDGAKAASLAAELKKQGFSAYTEKAGTVTRVRVGPVPARSEAEKLAARLRAQGHNAVLTPR